jgi:hypothetical protein
VHGAIDKGLHQDDFPIEATDAFNLTVEQHQSSTEIRGLQLHFGPSERRTWAAPQGHGQPATLTLDTPIGCGLCHVRGR